MAEHIVDKPGGDGGYYNPGLGNEVKPGDKIIIQAGQRLSYFYPGILKGTPDAPIIIQNRGGIAEVGGFACGSWQDVKVIGDGDTAMPFGFYCDSKAPSGTWRGGAAISIDGYASRLEFSRLDINNQGFGAWIKNEPSCDDKLNAHVIYDINIHHCRIQNTQVEGIYAGSTNFVKGKTNVRPLSCGGVPRTILPPDLGNIRINDNEFKNTGRAAIQLSYASVGISEIMRNKISRVGLERNDTQGNGINIGSLSRVIVRGNYIRNTLCAGVCTFGLYTEISENDIDDSGFLDDLVTLWAWGIWCDTRESTPLSKMRVKIQNNKMGRRGVHTAGYAADIFLGDQYGIQANVIDWETNNIVAGNFSTVTAKEALVYADPRVKYSSGVIVPPAEPTPLFTIHAYADKTVSTAKSVSKTKKLLANIAVYANGDVKKV